MRPPKALDNMIRAVKKDDLIVTPQFTKWIVTRGGLGPQFRPDIVERVRQIMTNQPRVRTSTFSASSSGQCPRRQMLSYIGVPIYGMIDPRLQFIFLNGHFLHLMVQCCLMECRAIDDIEFPLTWPAMHMYGTMDGVGIVPNDHPRTEWRGEEFILEIKGLNSYKFASEVTRDATNIAYKKQVAKYMMLSGTKLVVVFYVNKDTLDTKEWVFTRADLQVYIDQAEKETQLLANHVKAKTLPDPLKGAQRGLPKECHECQYAGKDGPCLTVKTWKEAEKWR